VNPKLRNYKRCPDGRYRRQVDFDIRNKPGIVSRINLVRSSDGALLKTENLGRFRLPTPNKT
jgi:hypothetical protein